MKNTGKRHLHIVAFATPYPANYGGVIEVFYKLRALSREGVLIHLHAFTYNNHPPAKELETYCETVTYYRRKTGLKAALSLKPYIVKSRENNRLLHNLLKDDYPILFEGLHSCGYISHPKLKNRVKVFRECNIEHHYYYNLAKASNSLFDKIYYLTESFRLKLFQRRVSHADYVLGISQKDTNYLYGKFPHNKVIHLPAFHENEDLSVSEGTGNYALYHGNMSVAENYLAAQYLIKKVFADLSTPLVIAGKKPPEHLKVLAAKYPHITIEDTPDDTTMSRLISEAQVHILITFQATGLKLKLLNTLFRGRHILVNPQMVAGTLAEPLCETGHSDKELQQKVQQLMKTPFDSTSLHKRNILLQKHYSNQHNAQKLIEWVFSGE